MTRIFIIRNVINWLNDWYPMFHIWTFILILVINDMKYSLWHNQNNSRAKIQTWIVRDRCDLLETIVNWHLWKKSLKSGFVSISHWKMFRWSNGSNFFWMAPLSVILKENANFLCSEKSLTMEDPVESIYNRGHP